LTVRSGRTTDLSNLIGSVTSRDTLVRRSALRTGFGENESVCLVVKSIIIAVVLILAAVHLLFAGANFQVGEAGEGVVAIVAGVSLVAAVAFVVRGAPNQAALCALLGTSR
jgi:hypothetical protein